MKILLLLLPLLAHADDFSDRARQAAQQREAQREAANVRAQDQRNLAIIAKMNRVEKVNGGLNSTGKCYDTTFEFSGSWKKVDWCAGSVCMPIYSRYWQWEQKMQLGFNEKAIDACTFNTNNGFACEVQIGGDDSDGGSYVMCYDKKNVQYQANAAGKLVRYVAPPPTEPTPWTPCETERMHWAEAQAECDRMNDSHDRDLCRSALSQEPTCTN